MYWHPPWKLLIQTNLWYKNQTFISWQQIILQMSGQNNIVTFTDHGSWCPLPRTKKRAQQVSIHFISARWHLCSIFEKPMQHAYDHGFTKPAHMELTFIMYHSSTSKQTLKKRNKCRGSVLGQWSCCAHWLTEWLSEGHLDCAVLSCVMLCKSNSTELIFWVQFQNIMLNYDS